jgi:hypothetical protein
LLTRIGVFIRDRRLTVMVTRTAEAAAKRHPAAPAQSRVGRTVLIYLKPELLRQLRFQSAHEGRPMSAVVASALESYILAHPITVPPRPKAGGR